MNHFAEYCITTKKREQRNDKQFDKPVGRPNRGYKPKYNRQNRQGIYEIEYQQSSQSDGDYEHEHYPIDEMKCKEEIHTTLTLGSSPVELKVDTGATCNVMPLQTLKQINPNKQINRGVNPRPDGGSRVDKHQIKVHSVHRIFRVIFLIFFFAIVKKFVEKKNWWSRAGSRPPPPGSAPDVIATTTTISYFSMSLTKKARKRY